jgi:glycosyltransferase involved in cell wall biosynthesis
MPVFRDHYVYEEMTFIPGLWSSFDPAQFDATVTCSYPFVNWALRSKRSGSRPVHLFVTQNGDWAAYARHREYRLFSCDGLVCTNPQFFERNRDRWRCELIPNGVDPARFTGVAGDRTKFGVPAGAPLALMVSALIPSKRVLDGLRAAADIPGLHLLVLGDGEQREEVDALGRKLMPERYRRMTVPYDQIAAVYASADVLLHMSKDESFGNIYIEALASGLPVVAHDTPVTRWILGPHAMLVDSDDPTAVTRALQESLMDNTPSAAAARREYAADRFAWSVVADQYARFIATLLREVA